MPGTTAEATGSSERRRADGFTAYTQRILSSSRIVRFSHTSRYESYLALLGSTRYGRAVDFGGADGHFLRLAWRDGHVESGVVLDNSKAKIHAAVRRFAGNPQLQALLTRDPACERYRGSCDVGFCVEVLEHVQDPQSVLLEFLSYIRPGAPAIVSVPIEMGPVLVLKQLGRRLTHMMSPAYDFERYRPAELYRAVVRRDVGSFPSTHASTGVPRNHKGFDYRTIQELLRQHLRIEETRFSPWSRVGPPFNTTILWKCRLPAGVQPARRSPKASS